MKSIVALLISALSLLGCAGGGGASGAGRGSGSGIEVFGTIDAGVSHTTTRSAPTVRPAR